MTNTRKLLSFAALALVATAAFAGVAHADWVDAWGVVHGCRQFVNPYTGLIYTQCI